MRSNQAALPRNPGLPRTISLTRARRSLVLGLGALAGAAGGWACAGPGGSLPTASATATPSATEPAPPSGAPAGADPAPPRTAASAGGSAPITRPEAVGSSAPASEADSCGPLDCRLFATPADAFAYVLTQKPLVLALGESHAQKGSEAVASTTKRFTEQLLPLLKGRASDLVVELWVADGKCGKVETQVAGQQKPVTEHQAASNQGEFVTLGTRAKELGILPLPLRPSCEEYERIAKAGPNDVPEMMMMIARHTEADIRRLLAQGPQPSEGRLIVAYGGAMHNDLYPTEERKAWSFGPELSAATGGRYVELDLVVPEFIRDTDGWKSFAWYPAFDKSAHPKQTTLYRPKLGSYVLIFPGSK